MNTTALAETAPPNAWNEALLARYDVAGPRYTSYPTALQFSPVFGPDDYRALWRDSATSTAPLSLYVHIPFCENICYYCACNKVVTRRHEQARRYLDYLEREIRLQSALIGSHRPVTQLHWGGGTPTYLSGAEQTELMHALASHFQLQDGPGREYAIEIDPRTIDRDALALLKGLGFNRLSFGVQDFDERVQRAINRLQSPQQVATLVDAARGFGFTSIGFDLIYGLPYQTPTSLDDTLRRVIELAPDRIACYNYAHLPRRFPSQRAIDRHSLPGAREKLALLTRVFERLGAAGYHHIGMDHFVQPGDELALAQRSGRLQRNFQGYATNHADDLVGLGVSAIGSTPLGHAQNSRTLADYYQRLDRGELPVERGLFLHADDRIRRHVIMALICNLELDLDTLPEKFGVRFADYFRHEHNALALLAADGLLTLDERRLAVTPAGRYLLRNICMVFDRYLNTAQPGYSRAL